MKAYIVIFLVCLVLLGCQFKPKQSSINKYDQLADNVGEKVTVSGYLSKTHGAYGLYFNSDDLMAENSNCLSLSENINGEHGSKVQLTGRLVISECSIDTICFNTCQEFSLIQEDGSKS